MRARAVASLFLFVLLAALAAGQSRPDVKDARLLAQPVADAGDVRNPVFSPDGRWIACTGPLRGPMRFSEPEA